MPLIDFSHKPTGWLKRMLKAPTYIYRARLGIFFGYRFVMIEHRGRNTGTRHFTVVEVARHLPRGVGVHFRNRTRCRLVSQSPSGRPRGSVGRVAAAPGIRPIPRRDEAARRDGRLRASPSKTAAKLYSMMGVSYDGTDEGRVEMMAKIPMVAFSPRDVHTAARRFSSDSQRPSHS